jgi:hypothetical protein
MRLALLILLFGSIQAKADYNPTELEIRQCEDVCLNYKDLILDRAYIDDKGVCVCKYRPEE